MAYNKTTWQNGQTPVDANNLNKLETGLAEATVKLEKLEQQVSNIQQGGGGNSGSGGSIQGSISSDNVFFSSLKLHSTKETVPSWDGSATITFTNNGFTATKNAQGFIRSKNIKSSKNYIRIVLNITKQNEGGLCLALIGNKSAKPSEESFSMLGTLTETGVIERVVDLNERHSSEDLDLDSPYRVQLSSFDGHNLNFECAEFSIYEATGEENSAGESLTSYASSVNKKLEQLENGGSSSGGTVSANNVVFDNPIIHSTKETTLPWDNSATITFTSNGFTAIKDTQGFICTKSLKSTKGYIQLEIDFVKMNEGGLCLALVGSKASDTSQECFIVIDSTISSVGKYTKHLDLNYYSAHQDLSLDRPYRLQLSCFDSYALNIECSKFVVYDEVNEQGGQTLSTYVSSIDSKLGYLESSIENNRGHVILSDSDGNTYYLGVENGQIVLNPTLAKNVLFIGNSLLGGFGGNDEGFGICASDNKHDYYALVTDFMAQRTDGTINKSKCVDWSFEEASSLSEAESVINSKIKPKLKSNLELVIVQLGDNVSASNLDVFKQSSAKLVDTIKATCPNAKIAWVGFWFSTSAKKQAITSMCNEKGVVFIDISDMNDVAEYRDAKGTTVTMPNGSTHVVTAEGEYNHPSNNGFKVIAQRITKALFG